MPPPPRLHHVTRTIRWASTAPKQPQPRAYQAPQTPRPTPSEPPPTSRSVRPTLLEKFDRTRTVPKSRHKGTTGRIVTGCIGGGLALYIAALVYDAQRPVKDESIKSLDQQKDVSARYDDTADSFDSDVAFQEWLAGITRRRERLAKMCKGHVLEVSCGTGRNLGYFDIGPDSKVESLTFVDLSPQMIDVCKRKWSALYSSDKKGLKPGLQVRFMAGSALARMPAPPDGEKGRYDTILQTMGLCSTPSPVTLLTNMASHLNTANPDARIFLLEHGRSYRDWLNRILDNSAEKHAEIHGCWFNRDIGALVEEAAEKAGLEVMRARRWHLGTTWMFELKAKAGIAQAKGRQEEAEKELAEMKGSGWFGWK